MANDIVDILQIKIERAKEKLPEDTQNAIAAVDWKAAILSLREKKGYNFEQLGELETETELILCGLLDPADYQKEIQARMDISKAEAGELVEEMNDLVFKKIKEELIKNTERKKIFAAKSSVPEQILPEMNKSEEKVLQSAGIEVVTPISTTTEKPPEAREEILEKVENPESPGKGDIHPMVAEKLSATFQTPSVKTEHEADAAAAPAIPAYPPKKDPYRLAPED